MSSDVTGRPGLDGTLTGTVTAGVFLFGIKPAPPCQGESVGRALVDPAGTAWSDGEILGSEDCLPSLRGTLSARRR